MFSVHDALLPLYNSIRVYPVPVKGLSGSVLNIIFQRCYLRLFHENISVCFLFIYFLQILKFRLNLLISKHFNNTPFISYRWNKIWNNKSWNKIYFFKFKFNNDFIYRCFGIN